jgi:hypothetical protein
MFSRHFGANLALGLGAALPLCLVMVGSAHNPAPGQSPDAIPPTQLVIGDAATVEGHVIVTWARVHARHGVQEVGVTIPVALFDDQPEPGSGPAGAIASLVFPEIVRDTTFFNHFELHSQAHGHETPPGSTNPIRNSVAHYDFHFYAIDEEEVWLIPGLPAPLPRVSPELLPIGYRQPGGSSAEMGRHAAPQSSFLDPNFLSTVTIAGFVPDGSYMHFIEPMISRDFLLERAYFELAVPTPQAFGRLMFYPKTLTAEYDSDLDAYHFVFSEFVAVE